MSPLPDDPQPTRASLLERARHGDDRAGWEDFYRTYHGLIHGFARQCGLTDSEAEDVVQTTMSSVVEALPDFRYEPERCRFKSWLLLLAGRRVVDFKRKLGRQPVALAVPRDTESTTDMIEALPDPERTELESIWAREWQNHLLNVAADRLKRQTKPAHFQIFYLHVLKERPAREVAQTLGVRLGQVYLVGHRLRREFKKAIEAERKKG